MATITCSKCQNVIEITELLNADLRLIADSQAQRIVELEGLLKSAICLLRTPENHINWGWRGEPDHYGYYLDGVWCGKEWMDVLKMHAKAKCAAKAMEE